MGVRKSAMRALGNLGERAAPAVPQLIAAIDNEWTRYAAVEAIAGIGPAAKEAIPRLIALLRGERSPAPNPCKALAYIGLAAVPALLDELHTGDAVTTHNVYQTIGLMNEECLPALTAALKTQDVNNKVAILEGLRYMGQRAAPAIPDVAACLGDSRLSVRINAIYTLANMGPASASAIPELLPALDDPETASTATYALARMGETARPILAAEMEAGKVYAATSLAVMGTPAVPALIDALDLPYLEVREAAIKSLIEIGIEGVPGLLPALSDDPDNVRAGVAQVLATLVPDSEDAVTSLTAALNDTNPDVVRFAAQALGELGHASQNLIETLTKLAETSENASVRRAAKDALNTIRPKPLDYGFELVKSQIPSAHPAYRHFEFTLRYPETGDSFFLARLCMERDQDNPLASVSGLDEESLRLTWAQENRLLQVQWETIPQGNGLYVCLSTLLLLRTNAGWHELFRDTISQSTVQSRSDSSAQTTLAFRSTANPKQVILHVNSESYQTWTGDGTYPLASAQKNRQSGEVWYTRRLNIHREYPCTIEGNGLQIHPGVVKLLLGNATFPVREVVEYFPKHEMDLEDRIEQVQDMNPQLDNSGNCTGEIIVDIDIPPYVPFSEHVYSGSDTASCPCA